MVCEQISWRGRSAVRDSARVLGFSVQQAEAIAAFSDRFSARATADALRGRAVADAYTQDNPECTEDGGKAAELQDGRKDRDDDLAFFSPASIRRRDAEKRALANTLGQQMIPGTEAKTKADAVKRLSYGDPHAEQDHVERRNPVTSLLGSTEDTSVLTNSLG
jgi:hypothetical protein